MSLSQFPICIINPRSKKKNGSSVFSFIHCKKCVPFFFFLYVVAIEIYIYMQSLSVSTFSHIILFFLFVIFSFFMYIYIFFFNVFQIIFFFL